jgi:hypothetical protein
VFFDECWLSALTGDLSASLRSIGTRAAFLDRLRCRWALVLLLGGVPTMAAAQDSVAVAPPADSSAPGLGPIARRGKSPPPRGALIRSLILPGWGQFHLNRKTMGVIFLSTEAVFVGLVLREQGRIGDLRAAGADTSVVNAAKRKREDWIVLGLVNHVAAGIEAYVTAHLFDFPDELKVRAMPDGRVRANVILPIRVR